MMLYVVDIKEKFYYSWSKVLCDKLSEIANVYIMEKPVDVVLSSLDGKHGVHLNVEFEDYPVLHVVTNAGYYIIFVSYEPGRIIPQLMVLPMGPHSFWLLPRYELENCGCILKKSNFNNMRYDM